MGKLKIPQLISGGVITNYFCTSRCRHCLYGCSPQWEKNYITESMSKTIFDAIRILGCSSIHIGGGEPFLNFTELLKVVQSAYNSHIHIEYIETNSSWFKDESDTERKLEQLKEAGVNTLLISMSPFHNEYIPFKKVKALIKSCHKSGIQIFPWIQDFYNEIDGFDQNSVHTLEEYTQKYGEDYIHKIPSRYWIHYTGRALETFSTVFPLKSLENILQESGLCRELADTSHFHIDLFGNYIPGLCSGMAIALEDLQNSLEQDQYPVLNMLYSGGISELFHFAAKEYGFSPNPQYLSKCHLCTDIRKYLVIQKKIESKELKPKEFYYQV